MPFTANGERKYAFLLKGVETIEDYGIYSINPDGIITAWNLGAQHNTGYTAEEVIGKHTRIFYDAETIAEGYVEEMLRIAKEQGHHEEEGWRLRKDGSRFWALMTLEAVYDEHHNLQGFTRIVRDLTERKQAEIALKESEERYYKLLQTSQIIPWSCNSQGAFIHPQPAWEIFTGQSWEEYREFGWLDAFHAEDRENLRSGWQEAQTTKIYRHVARLWSKQAQDYRYTLVQASASLDEKGEVQQWLGNNTDIHELKIVLNHLKLTHLVANAGNWILDFTNDVLSWDDDTYRLFGITPATQTIRSLNDKLQLVHPEDRNKVAERINAVRRGEKDYYQAVYRVIWPDGSLHYLMSNAYVSQSKQGAPTKLMGTILDITQQRQLEQERLKAVQLAEEQQRKRAEDAEAYSRRQVEFINTTCHEVRNPLVGIYGNVDTLKTNLATIKSLLSSREASLSPMVTASLQRELLASEEAIEIIEQCASSQKALLDEVLDLAKLEAGRTELQAVAFNPELVITQLAARYSDQLSKKGLNISLRLAAANDWIKADRHRFSQVLTNLLTNAIKFTDKGSILIKAKLVPVLSSVNDFYLKCSVTDTGRGMLPEEVARLFTPFAQASPGISSEYGGTGLGLAICKHLVALMGGEIHVESQRWQGTTFSFKVHCMRLTEEEKLAQQKQQKQSVHPLSTDIAINVIPAPGKTVLIVEDNLINQKVLARFLEQAGYFYHIANNGLEAVEKFQRFPFDIIFMDVAMPVMNGLEATRKIRELEQQQKNRLVIPIIGLSANAGREQIAEAKTAGMSDYVTKPFVKEEIYRVIKDYTQPRLLHQAAAPLPQVATRVSQTLWSAPASAAPLSGSELNIVIERLSAINVIQEQHPFLARREGRKIFLELPTSHPQYPLERRARILDELREIFFSNLRNWLGENLIEVTSTCLTIQTASELLAEQIETCLRLSGLDYAFKTSALISLCK